MLAPDTEGFTQIIGVDAAAEQGKVIVEFYDRAVPDPVETEKQGRPIYKEVTYVRIYAPGDRNSVVDRPAWEQDYRRYPKFHEIYKRKETGKIVGTPLAAVPWMDRATVEELRYFNCITVENLAGMSDEVCGRFPGIRALQKRAQDFLEAAKGSAGLNALRAENERKDNEIDTLKKQLQQQADRIAKLESQVPQHRR